MGTELSGRSRSTVFIAFFLPGYRRRGPRRRFRDLVIAMNAGAFRGDLASIRTGECQGTFSLTFSSHFAWTESPHALHVFPSLLNPQIEVCFS